MPKIEGGCLCGAVRYTCDQQPVVTAICLCTHCQRQSGSAFSVNLGIPKGSLKLTGDSLVSYRDTGSSGQPVHRKFCGKCGSPILSDVEATPQVDFLKAGTLDDPSWVQPQAAIWCNSAQPWTTLPEGIPQFPESPPSS